MKVLFLNPPFKFKISRASRWPELTKSGTLYYPFWLSYAAGVCMQKHEVTLLDSIAKGLGFRETIKRIKKFSPDLLVAETSTPTFNSDLKFLEKVKEEIKTKIALVGTHASVFPEEALKSKGVDFVARKEYDYTILELADTLEKKGDLEKVLGLSFKKGKKIVHNPDRPPIKDLDSLPFVSKVYKKFLDVKNYRYALALHPMIQILSSRGCPNLCTFCDWPHTFMGRLYRTRSPENFVDELEFIANEMPEIKEIFIEDDTFTILKDRVVKICDLIKERKLDITWSANVRADIPFSVLKKMKDAGCRILIVGYECIKGDTYVFLPDGRIRKISECNSPILSFDFETMNQTFVNSIKLQKSGKHELLTLETGTRSITCTPEHRFFVLTEEGIREKKARDIKLGDFVAVIRRLKIKGTKKIGKELCELLGYFMGDGYCDIRTNKKYRIRIWDKNKLVLTYYSKIIRKLFNRKGSIYPGNSKRDFVLTVGCKFLALLIDKIGLNKPSNKRIIPDCITQLKNEELACFLRGYFDAEGAVQLHPKSNLIRLTSASRELLIQTKWLLLRFGIESNKIKKQRNTYGEWYYFVIKRRESIEKFAKYIGFNHPEKQKSLNKLLKRFKKRSFRREQSDIIPFQILKPLINLLKVGKGYKSKYAHIRANFQSYVVEQHNFSKRLLAKKLLELKRLGIEKDFPEIKSYLAFLFRLISSEIGWEKIEKIKKARKDFVFDFHVPILGNYIANGFIVHNSGNQQILNNIKKGITLEQAEKFTEAAKNAGLKIFGCFMIGLPGETKETIEQTFQFAKKLNPDMAFFQQAVPFPGTEFYNWCKQNGYLITEDFDKWLDANGRLDFLVSYPNLSNEELRKIRDKLMLRFYTSPKHVWQTITHNLSFDEISRLFNAAKSYLSYLIASRRRK